MSAATGTDIRRRDPRHATNGLMCQLGEVLDLSRGGMRVLCKGRLPINIGQSGSLRLSTKDGEITVNGRIVWTQRVGLRKHHIGIQFLQVRPGVAEALDAIACFGFLPDSFGEAIDRAPRTKRPRIRASFSVPDYYHLLGVAGDATSEQIHKAYRMLALKYHPDTSPDPASQKRFVQIAEAYEILKDPAKRALYDLKQAC